MSAAILYGCDSLLDIPAESVITSQSFWKTENDANAGLNGAYSLFRSAFEGQNLFIWGDYRTGFYGDNINNGYATYGNLWDNQLDPTTRGTDWGNLYKAVNTCNLVLSHVPDISFKNEKSKDNILGQAYFLRAYLYWQIVRIWGDAPLMTVGIESDDENHLYPSRQPVDKVFELIESDLDMAKSMIGSSNGIYKANLATVCLLQTDVYLWQYKVNGKGADYLTKASSALASFENANTSNMSPDYESVFRNESNSEIVFSIPFIQEENENSAKGFINLVSTVVSDYQNNPVPVGPDTQWMIITDKHRAFLSEDTNDVRADVNAMMYEAPTGDTYRWINKYLGTWKDGTRYSDTDYRLYRYADAVMLKAEILNEQGNQSGAIAEVNKIAKRAYGKDSYYAGTYSKVEVDEIITNERIKEFATEGKLWFDLIRLGKSFEKIGSLAGKENKEGILLWPVSNATINNNSNMTQTPGY